jgi:hypothetical protein
VSRSALSRSRLWLFLTAFGALLCGFAVFAIARAAGDGDAGGRAASTGWDENGPVFTQAELGSQPPGFYQLLLDEPRPGVKMMPVYWAPRDTAQEAPSVVRESKAYPLVTERNAPDQPSPAEMGDLIFFEDGVVLGSSREVTGGVSKRGDDPKAPDCTDDLWCIYEDIRYNHHDPFSGDYVLVCCNPDWFHLSSYNMNDKASSEINRRNRRAKLSEDIDGDENPGGALHCYNPGTHNPSFTSGFNDEASGAKIWNQTGDC